MNDIARLVIREQIQRQQERAAELRQGVEKQARWLDDLRVNLKQTEDEIAALEEALAS